MLLLPYVDACPIGVFAAQRDLRLTVMFVSIGRNMTGQETLYAQLRRCTGGKIVDAGCLRLWLNDAGGLWLLTDPHEPEPEPVCFRLTPNGPVIDGQPWRNEAELKTGLARADVLVP